MIQKKRKSSVTVLLLISIFFIPMLAAWLSYTQGFFLTGSTVNHGLLLSPPLSLGSLSLQPSLHQDQKMALKGKWSLVFLIEEPKGKTMERALYYMRQIRQATGKNRDRVTRAIITMKTDNVFETWLSTSYPDLAHFIITPAKLQEFASHLPKSLALKKGSLYLVDPLGNIILFYAPDAPPKGILKDLEKVLKVSQIG